MFLSGLKVWMALMRPIVPIEIRSSMWMPVFSNRRAMYTTSRRLCSMSREAASSLPAASARMVCCSASRSSGAGMVSLPPM